VNRGIAPESAKTAASALAGRALWPPGGLHLLLLDD
jgi:hypothetical protein